MLQLCFRSSYLSRWSWWRKRRCLHQGMLEQSFRWCWFSEKYPWGGRWLYDVSRPSICHYQKLWKCHHCFWWYRCVCLFDLPFQLMDLSWFEGNVNSQWKEWLNNCFLSINWRNNSSQMLLIYRLQFTHWQVFFLLLSKTCHLTRFSVAFWSYFFILKFDFEI